MFFLQKKNLEIGLILASINVLSYWKSFIFAYRPPSYVNFARTERGDSVEILTTFRFECEIFSIDILVFRRFSVNLKYFV